MRKEVHIETVKSEVDQLKDIVVELEKEVKDLRDFKKKVEVGSYLIRCTAYTVGAIIVFLVSLFPYLERWFPKH